MTTTQLMVEGEPVDLILEALQELMADSVQVDGMIRFKGALVGESGAALAHALGRVTAELQAADMRSFLPGRVPNRRTPEQRGADAFTLLTERLSEAVGAKIV